MYPRTNYEMTQEDLDTLMEAMKPVPVMMIGGTTPRSQQENANAAWERLGEKMGFDSDTVQPTGKGDRFFSAIPSETELHRKERLERESEEKRQLEISQISAEIQERQDKLDALLSPAEALK